MEPSVAVFNGPFLQSFVGIAIANDRVPYPRSLIDTCWLVVHVHRYGYIFSLFPLVGDHDDVV